jgi:gliding motility-associated-like protein/uncharacterized repeat protein (TIGR01451 family)
MLSGKNTLFTQYSRGFTAAFLLFWLLSIPVIASQSFEFAGSTTVHQKQPQLTLTKTATPQTYSAEDEEITYTITVTNTGTETLTNVLVSDPLTGLTALIIVMPPDASHEYTETYLIDFDDLLNGSVENTATATGFDPEMNEISVSATEIITAELDALEMLLVSQTDVLCFGEATGAATVAVSGGLEPYAITWYTDPVQSGPAAINLPAGTFVVEATDTTGASVQLEVTISQPEEPLDIMAELTHLLCHDDTDGAIVVEVFGGTPPYTFLWSSGETTQNISQLGAGSYTLTIEDYHGCTMEETFILQQPDPLAINNISITGVLCKEDPEGAIAFTVSGGTEPYAFNWDDGFSGKDRDGLTGGDYLLEVTDANGCGLWYDFFVPYQAEDCELRISQGLSPNGDGFNDFWNINGLIRYPQHVVRVFNRYGTLVFEASPYFNDWEATPNRGRTATGPDGKLPAGTYFYVIELEPGVQHETGYIYIAR